MLFVRNITRNIYKNMKEVVVVQIQKHMRKYKAQKAQKHVQCRYRSMCADRKLRKCAIEYEEPVAEDFPLSMKNPVGEGFKISSMVLKLSQDLSMA